VEKSPKGLWRKISLSERALEEILILRIFWALTSKRLFTKEGIQDLVGWLIRTEISRFGKEKLLLFLGLGLKLESWGIQGEFQKEGEDFELIWKQAPASTGVLFS
jgi:hypothetical protein